MGNVLVTGCEDGIARLWRYGDFLLTDAGGDKMDTDTGTGPRRNPRRSTDEHLVAELVGHVSPITDIQMSNLGDRLLTGSQIDGNVRVWSFSKDYTK